MGKPIIRSVAIEMSEKAFLPEAYAYRDMFRGNGVKADLLHPGDSKIMEYDAVVLFHGFHPFWRSYPRYIIGEYHSLTVGRLGRFKDFLKRVFNVGSDYYIFLNDFVRQKMWFSRKGNMSLRGMGYNDSHEFIGNEGKEFDIVYCGSYRDGLFDAIEKLVGLDFSVALVGVDQPFEHSRVKNFGKVHPDKALGIVSNSRFGLNFMPNVFPLNMQDSTKVIEYCGLGLGVITTDYPWVRSFQECTSGVFLYMDDIACRSDILNFNYVVPDVNDLRWGNVVDGLFSELSSVFDFKVYKC